MFPAASSTSDDGSCLSLPTFHAERKSISSPAGSTVITRALRPTAPALSVRSEEHTSELQSPCKLVWRLLLEKKKLMSRTDARPECAPSARQYRPDISTNAMATHATIPVWTPGSDSTVSMCLRYRGAVPGAQT